MMEASLDVGVIGWERGWMQAGLGCERGWMGAWLDGSVVGWERRWMGASNLVCDVLEVRPTQRYDQN